MSRGLGAGPFLCVECGERFATAGGLRIHARDAHGTPPLEPVDE